MKNCIYCSTILNDENKSREHCLPFALGDFKNCHILYDKVCKDCNAAISKHETQFLRAGPFGLMRHGLSFSGRKHHQKSSPFYEEIMNALPVNIKKFHPQIRCEIYWETIPGQQLISEARQIIL